MRCLMCGKECSETGSLAALLFSDDLLCDDCRSKWNRIDSHFIFQGVKALACWDYNDAYRSALIQFKELGDEALRDIFFRPMHKELHRKYRGYTLLLMPSSAENMERRGFSHLREMYSSLNLEMMEPFEKCHGYEQKRADVWERREMKKEIRLKKNAVLPRKIVLCDDVMTSGSTIAGALSCIDPSKHKILICVNSRVRMRNEQKCRP